MQLIIRDLIYRSPLVSLGDNTKALDEVIEIVIELIKKVK